MRKQRGEEQRREDRGRQGGEGGAGDDDPGAERDQTGWRAAGCTRPAASSYVPRAPGRFPSRAGHRNEAVIPRFPPSCRGGQERKDARRAQELRRGHRITSTALVAVSWRSRSLPRGSPDRLTASIASAVVGTHGDHVQAYELPRLRPEGLTKAVLRLSHSVGLLGATLSSASGICAPGGPPSFPLPGAGPHSGKGEKGHDDHRDRQRASARRLAARGISTAIVRLLREYTGRGPTKAHTTIRDNVVLVMLEQTLTKGEQVLVERAAARTCSRCATSTRRRCATKAATRSPSSPGDMVRP